MAKKIGQAAAKPNPALKVFEVLVGQWETTGSHPLMPGVTLHGRANIGWLENGAFLIMHTEIDEAKIPSGIAILGSDDTVGDYFMLYFDERGVSRKYDLSIKGNQLKWWRNNPEFSQTFTLDITDNGHRMIGQGQMQRGGLAWEDDLELTYNRIH